MQIFWMFLKRENVIEATRKFLFQFRIWMYASGIITIIWTHTSCTPRRYVPQVKNKDWIAFWPPDMIPHPVVPGDHPSGPGGPTNAST